MNITQALENAALRRRVAELEQANRTLRTALDEATAAMRDATRAAEMMAEASVTLTTPDGQTVTRRLADCVTATVAAPPERRN